MIQFRMKKFAAPQNPQADQQPQPTSQELLIQQMRLQRQIIQTQQQRQRLQQQERMARIRQANQMQRAKNEDAQEDTKNQIKIRKMQDGSEQSDNTSLYKSKAKVTPPVPMKV